VIDIHDRKHERVKHHRLILKTSFNPPAFVGKRRAPPVRLNVLSMSLLLWIN
jgi:hypothetical protein